MVVLSLVDAKHDDGLGEEGLALAVVPLDVEAQRPGRRRLRLAEDVVERVDGDLARGGGRAVREPDLDAAVVVGDGLELLCGLRAAGALETHADRLGGPAGRGVEDVAGDGVFGGHCWRALGVDDEAVSDGHFGSGWVREEGSGTFS